MLAVCFSTSAVLCLETEEFITTIRRPSAHKRDNFEVKCTFYPHHLQSLVNESCYAKIRGPLLSLMAATSGAITEMASICCCDSQFLSGWANRIAFWKAAQVVFLCPFGGRKLRLVFLLCRATSEPWTPTSLSSPLLSWTFQGGAGTSEGVPLLSAVGLTCHQVPLTDVQNTHGKEDEKRRKQWYKRRNGEEFRRKIICRLIGSWMWVVFPQTHSDFFFFYWISTSLKDYFYHPDSATAGHQGCGVHPSWPPWPATVDALERRKTPLSQQETLPLPTLAKIIGFA